MRILYLLSFLFITVGTNITAQPDTEIFPDFTYTDLEGTEHNLQSYLDDGKIVVIDVFATWCSNCQSSVAGWEELYNLHGQAGDESMVLLSFERDANTSNEAQYIEDYGIESPVITEAEDVIDELWNITYQPRYFVICPDGTFHSNLSQPIYSDPQILIDLSDECELSANALIESEVFSFQLTPAGDNKIGYLSSGTLMDYDILDVTGTHVSSGTLEGQSGRIDIATLRNGIYLLAVRTDKDVKTLRFLKD